MLAPDCVINLNTLISPTSLSKWDSGFWWDPWVSFTGTMIWQPVWWFRVDCPLTTVELEKGEMCDFLVDQRRPGQESAMGVLEQKSRGRMRGKYTHGKAYREETPEPAVLISSATLPYCQGCSVFFWVSPVQTRHAQDLGELLVVLYCLLGLFLFISYFLFFFSLSQSA